MARGSGLPEVAPLRAIMCDMDGLLIDSEPLSALAFARFLERRGRTALPETMERTLGRRLPEAMAIIKSMYELEDSPDSLQTEFDRLRLDALRGNVLPMPGALELLHWARAAGLSIALATSSARNQADISLSETGLTGLFDAEVTGDEIEHGKPDPDIYLLAGERLGTPPGSCVVLEDAPAGLAAAAAAGMHRLWVPNPTSAGLDPVVSVDARLTDLLAARDWLETYLARSHGETGPNSATVITGSASR